ncbi:MULTISPECIES: GlsB/YeaQ/YmgE family stress response membrane protein [Bacillaceae]|uniref:GlsB/YeaQ/YmgE family stress response membrane protein n=1 Tax=Peribacillus deserti TaxID=673318 RepID=A0A2N5M3Z2_9BACI|nr:MULTISPECIES: GlsB/YeaQ/YmgE family stress response membrane protein [Peribacillus]PLT29080.1 GlsB/YeaQ/YmgE family stress response membrane protein [Peribacillus deserti]
MEFLWSLIIGGIIGWLAGMILGRDVPGGVIGNIIAGFIGAWLGGLIFGDWGPHIAGFAILPALIGAIILILIVSFIMKSVRGRNHRH